MTRVHLLLAISLCLHGEILLPTRDGVWWYGSRTVFVGDYKWPVTRPPLTVWGASQTFSVEPDYKNLSCNASTDTLTTTNRMYAWGGLPDGSEVVLYVSSGSAPAPIIPWNTDKWKRYYVRDWSGQSFKLAETPGGAPVDISSCGTGKVGLSFAGYTGQVALQAGNALGDFTIDISANTLARTDGQPHGFAANTAIMIQSTTGVLPSGVTNFDSSRLRWWCVANPTSGTFQIRPATLESSCSASTANPIVDFTDVGTGTIKLYVLTTPLSIRRMQGMPPGTILSWRAGRSQLQWPVADVYGATYLGYARLTESNTICATMIYKVPAITPARTWDVQIEVSEGMPNLPAVNPVTGIFPLETVAIRKIQKTGPTSYPSIPGYESGVIAASPHRYWRNILTSYKNGGGAEIGGSGTQVAAYPRCANRADPVAPISKLAPATYAFRGTATKSTVNSMTIAHTLGSTGINVQCGRGNSTSGYISVTPSAIVNTGTSATISWVPDPNSGTIVTCWLNREVDMDASRTMSPFVFSFSDLGSLQVWFYSDRNFFEIAKLTGDPTWASCGTAIADRWVSYFVNSQAAGYLTSPGTILGAYGWTGNPKYKVRIQKQISTANYFRGAVTDLAAREHAFRTENRMEAELVAGVPDPHLQYYVDSAIGMIYMNATGQPERTFNEPFITGLLMRVLIRWYLLTGDERIPHVTKILLDKFWADWYNHATHKQRYNAEPRGMRCWVNCTDDDTDGLGDGNWTGAALNGLIVPAFGWYWRLTGDDTYRVRGDDIFSTMMMGNTDPYYAKEYSQLYYWTWDYVRWRTGESLAHTAP